MYVCVHNNIIISQFFTVQKYLILQQYRGIESSNSAADMQQPNASIRPNKKNPRSLAMKTHINK